MWCKMMLVDDFSKYRLVFQINALKKSTEVQDEPSSQAKPNVHPLHSAWTWYYNEALNSRGQSSKWGDSMKIIHTFSSIEGFWGFVVEIYCSLNTVGTPTMHQVMPIIA